MMLYKLLVLVAMVLTANGARKNTQIAVVMKYVNTEYGQLWKRYDCCTGNYSLKLVMEKGLSDWVHIKAESDINYDNQITRNKYYVPLEKDKRELGPLKGFVVRYTKAPAERYVKDHGDFGFQGILQMKLWPTHATYPRKEEQSCVFTKTTYEGYTVVCLMKTQLLPNPSWMRMVKKAFPRVTYFEKVNLPNLVGASMEAGEKSNGLSGGPKAGLMSACSGACGCRACEKWETGGWNIGR